MSQRTRLVFNVQRFSLRDGPGIRTTVFLKGCPLACDWCHNPESRLAEREFVFHEPRCIRCGACAEACPTGALSGQGTCNGCGACVEACPTGARDVVGKPMTAAELFAEVVRDLVFYEESGGGVTFSGGEPLSDPEYLREILERCRTARIHTAVDTCGHAPPDAFRTVLPVTDLFLFDLKIMDPERHRRHTGVSNDLILRNLRELASSGARVVGRFPVIPGINDDSRNVLETGRCLAESGIGEVDLIPYHGLGSVKYRQLGRAYPLEDLRRPTGESLAAISGLLEGLGLRVRVIG